ncbi:MAG: DUF2156 domain-containing protein [Deltaproteobacteria bacterium]|nr:DUF2156 domain-containing protein [Deltaproteobacteria bacterium]
MYKAGALALKVSGKSDLSEFKKFTLNDRELIQKYIDIFKPLSCEYNFANLYAWQDTCKMSWTLYQERLLVYDGISGYAFMPLGEDFYPHELVILSLNLKNAGMSPNFSLVSLNYLKRFPEIEDHYIVKEEPDSAEYIYNTNSLDNLTGVKLHKKRNLISQFKRFYPDFEIHLLKGKYRQKALMLARNLMDRHKEHSATLDHEFYAMEKTFDHFDELGLEGLVINVREKIVAFCVFSELCHSTYDIQFEKADTDFKGAAQVINQEAAKYLKDKCQYLNREQDLGIKGLRRAKMSYVPEKLITPYSLIYNPADLQDPNW